MTGLILGMLATAAIILGGMCVLGKGHALSVFCGAADILLVVLSAQSFRTMLAESGKVLTQELFGFGYNRGVLAVYAVMLVIGFTYILLGAFGFAKNASAKYT